MKYYVTVCESHSATILLLSERLHTHMSTCACTHTHTHNCQDTHTK